MAQIVTITNPLTGQPAQVDQLEHTAQEIDDAIARALPGGAIDIASQNNDPRNWGLGGNAKLLTSADNLDNIRENGWYWWYDTRPSGAEYNYCHMRVDNGQTGTLSSVTQTIYRNAINSVMIRFYNGNTWITEYANPTMELGVEYRTTERYLWKPVYIKLVDCGALPNATTKTVNHGISDIQHIVEVKGSLYKTDGSEARSLPYWFSTEDYAEIRADKTSIYTITVGSLWETRKCYAVLKYTKTTD